MEITRVEPPYGTQSCSCVHYTFFYLFIYTDVTITNVQTVTNKQEMPHNKKQMEINVIRGSALYFLGIRYSLVSDHQCSWYTILRI